MKENEILSEIHRVREEIARECGYDVQEIFRRMRAQTEQLKAQGWRVVSPEPRERPAAAYALHDKPVEKEQ
jgi:pyridoxine 5'-phosphate synthase PdxJ